MPVEVTWEDASDEITLPLFSRRSPTEAKETTMSLKNKVAIVGADETDEIGIVPDMTPIMLHAQAARNALRDAGIDKSEVDAVFTCGIGGMASVQLCEYLGIVPKYIDSTMTGGSSFVIHVEHAAAAIAAGLCSVALITHGETGLSGRTRRGPRGGGGSFDATLPCGAVRDAVRRRRRAERVLAWRAMRHMHEYGTTQRAARGDRGRDAQVGAAQPARDHARPAHDRRRAWRRAGSRTRSTSTTAAS